MIHEALVIAFSHLFRLCSYNLAFFSLVFFFLFCSSPDVLFLVLKMFSSTSCSFFLVLKVLRFWVHIRSVNDIFGALQISSIEALVISFHEMIRSEVLWAVPCMAALC